MKFMRGYNGPAYNLLKGRINIMEESEIYYPYSKYLKNKYGEKVYKLPVNLPVSCPNRINDTGCTFCSEKGTGFESLNSSISVKEQLIKNKDYIGKRYNAKKFIAYFQNYTNTFMPLNIFKKYINEALEVEDIVEISISTRPDCIRKDYLDFLNDIKAKTNMDISIELGLQSINYHKLDKINRGHGLGEFISSVLLIDKYDFDICVHIILNLPYDTIRDNIETANVLSALPINIIKIHSLYIPLNTILYNELKNGKISLCDKEEYISRLCEFIEVLRPDIAIERLFSRVPKEDAVFSNWDCSWWKLKDDFLDKMRENNSFQGKKYIDLSSKSLTKVGYKIGEEKQY